jgi:hypothetical protein
MRTLLALSRIGLGTLLPLVMALLATPALAGEVVCGLQATVGGGSATELEVGEEVLIEGFGFPPGDVEVSYSSEGVFLRSVTVTADATGFFETTVVPAEGEEGLWSVEAVAGQVCTATTGFLVLAGATAPPTPTPTPVPTPAASSGTIPNVAVTSDAGSPPSLVLLGASLLLVAGSISLAGLLRRRSVAGHRQRPPSRT